MYTHIQSPSHLHNCMNVQLSSEMLMFTIMKVMVRSHNRMQNGSVIELRPHHFLQLLKGEMTYRLIYCRHLPDPQYYM